MDYTIRTREKMRYNTCGDYYLVGKNMFIDVMDQKNEDKNFLIMIHELIEEHLTRKRGIKEQEIMNFDYMFEKERLEGKWDEFAEPGYDPRSPYRKEHIFSENIERLLAQELGIDWTEYGQNLISE